MASPASSTRTTPCPIICTNTGGSGSGVVANRCRSSDSTNQIAVPIAPILAIDFTASIRLSIPSSRRKPAIGLSRLGSGISAVRFNKKPVCNNMLPAPASSTPSTSGPAAAKAAWHAWRSAMPPPSETSIAWARARNTRNAIASRSSDFGAVRIRIRQPAPNPANAATSRDIGTRPSSRACSWRRGVAASVRSSWSDPPANCDYPSPGSPA